MAARVFRLPLGPSDGRGFRWLVGRSDGLARDAFRWHGQGCVQPLPPPFPTFLETWNHGAFSYSIGEPPKFKEHSVYSEHVDSDKIIGIINLLRFKWQQAKAGVDPSDPTYGMLIVCPSP